MCLFHHGTISAHASVTEYRLQTVKSGFLQQQPGSSASSLAYHHSFVLNSYWEFVLGHVVWMQIWWTTL